MKKLILSIVLLSGLSLAQTTGALVGGGIVFADSLKTYSTAYASDSSMIVDLNLDWGFVSVTVNDTGTTYTDSIKCYKGSVVYTNGYSHTKVDTLWGTQAIPFKNNAWGNDTTMVGAGKISNYTLLDDNIQLLQIVRKNYGLDTIGKGIKTDIVIEAKKKK